MGSWLRERGEDHLKRLFASMSTSPQLDKPNHLPKQHLPTGRRVYRLSGDLRRSLGRSVIWIWLWIGGILFPMAFVAGQWSPSARLFNRLFASPWTHILMHAFLYAVLAMLLASRYYPSKRYWAGITVGVILIVALGQEMLQLFPQRTWPGWTAEMLDLSVDLGGGGLGLLAGYLRSIEKLRKDQGQQKSPSSGQTPGGEGGI